MERTGGARPDPVPAAHPAGQAEVRVERQGFSQWDVALFIAAAGLGLPAALTIDRLTRQDLSWLVALPVAALGWSVWALLLRDERWRAVAHLGEGRKLVLGSGDQQAMAALARQVKARLAVAPQRPPAHRLVFLDLVRSLAIAMMIFAHFSDQLVGPAMRGSAFGAFYDLSRGFTAPLFLVVSGWSFSTAVVPRLEVFGLAGADFGRRLRRVAVLLCWGYALTLPWWAPGFPFDAPADVWKPFWTAGVLESLAATLLATLGILWVARRPVPFLACCAVVAVAAIGLAPYVAERVALWPEPVRGFFDKQGVPGGFPLSPWAGYFLIGTLLGGALTLVRASASARGLALLGACGVAALGHLVAPLPWALVGLRLAVTCGALGLAAVLAARLTRVPAALRHVSQHALTFYVAHMLALWGAPNVVGLAGRYAGQLGWGECALLTLACLATTAQLLKLWSFVAQWVRRVHRREARTRSA